MNELKLPPELGIKKTPIGDMNAERLKTSGKANDQMILYFHGGGYVMGSCRGW